MGAEFPLENTPIEMTVDVGPIGAAFGRRGAIIEDEDLAVRFASDKSDPITVIDIESNQSELTIPYVTSAGTFDAGIAIANTSLDDSARTVDPDGAITFDFFTGGEMIISYETESGSPGSGLTSRGLLEAGGVYSVLLSQLLTAAGHDGDFTGYIVITTDFRPADGNVFITDWAGFAATGTVRQ